MLGSLLVMLADDLTCILMKKDRKTHSFILGLSLVLSYLTQVTIMFFPLAQPADF